MKKSVVLNTAMAVSLSIVSVASHAEIDVTAATSAISGDGGTAIAAIGTALIGLAGTAVVYKWVKGAIFS